MNRLIHFKKATPLLLVKTRILFIITLLCAAMAGVQGVHAAAPESSAAPKQTDGRKSARVEFSASRQRVGGREVAGFSARQALVPQEQNLTPPVGLKPMEQEAWLAMARRQGVSGGMGLTSFYPARYGEPYVVESEAVRVAVRPVGGTDVTAHIGNGQVTYRSAYADTDSTHVVSAGRSEEFLFLQDECAPREFQYELSELSAGTRVELVNGEVRFTNKAGRGVKIEAPWLIETNGALRADAVHWELDAANSAVVPQRLRLVVAEGLRYPLMIDPSWTTTGSLRTARELHTATLLPNGKVLVAGGLNNGIGDLSGAELYDPASGTWTATGSMGTGRELHTATLLPNGKVLVVGGFNAALGRTPLGSAELYDPASGTWTATGSLGSKRYNHTATLLPSGKVLVAGGVRAFTSAELYDPATGTWTSSGSLTVGRYAHTATLLLSGKVLVAGGTHNGSLLSSAELYDPAAGTWTTTGSLHSARDSHTATLLPNGMVLAAGGYGGISGSLSSAELYDPVAGTWTATGSLGTGRYGHTATLLPNGKVLVAGGYSYTNGNLSSAELYDPVAGTWTATGSLATARLEHSATLLPSGKVLVAGGTGSGGTLSSAELYDSAEGSWSDTGSLGTARYGHSATLLPSGEVLVAGGYGSNFLSSAELYDPAAGTWTATGSMGTARYSHTATLLPSGNLLVAGGIGSSGRLASAQLYDPETGTWTTTGSMSVRRVGHTATLLPSGKVLVAGGSISRTNYLTSAELYDPGTGTWTATGSMGTARSGHTATLLPSGKVLVASGDRSLTTAELYDPATGTWTATGTLVAERYQHTATLLPSGKVLVAGGLYAVNSAELYDPATGTWTATGSLVGPHYQHTATLLPSGKVLVAGGQNESSAELYDPAAGTWTTTGSMDTERFVHTATLLPSGKVLVAGGIGNLTLSSAELYDQGLGFDSNWQPLLTTVSPSILQNGNELTASGSRFKGISEASGGNGAQNSSSNYPLVQLLSLANEQTLFLLADPTAGWSDTSFTSTPITLMTTTSSGFPIGYALVTVFTNGIPSASQFVLGATPTPAP